MKKCLTVIIPAYNEEHSLAQTVKDVLNNECVSSIVVVNNNSTDMTNEIALNLSKVDNRIHVCQETRQGKGRAFEAGLLFWRKLNTEYAGVIDADDTYPAEHFDNLMSEVLKYELDMIVGNRFGHGQYAGNKTRFGHVVGNAILSRLIKFISSVDLEDALSGMRIFSRRYLENFKSISDGFQLETEFSVHCGQNGYLYGERPISYKERTAENPSKLSTFRDGLKILNFALTNTAFTLTSKIGFLVGLVFLFLGLFWGIYLCLEFVENSKVTSIAAAVAVSIFVSTGIHLIIGATIENRLRRIEKALIRK